MLDSESQATAKPIDLSRRARAGSRSGYEAVDFSSTGPAAKTAGLTPAAYDLKLSWNNVASLRAAASYSAGSLQVFFGIKISLGTPGHSVTTLSPK